MLPKSPSKAVNVLKHLWDQLYKSPRKCVLMDKMWSRDKEIGKYMYMIGKYKNKKNASKLTATVKRIKKHYKSLRSACLYDILCLCPGCLHGGSECKNVNYADKWRGFDMNNFQDKSNPLKLVRVFLSESFHILDDWKVLWCGRFLVHELVLRSVADPARAQGGPSFFLLKLPTARSASKRAKRAYIGRGPGPTLGPWKPLHF